MTPSKESLQAAEEWLTATDGCCIKPLECKRCSGIVTDIATLIDTAYAEHRERAARLEAALRKIANLTPSMKVAKIAIAALKEPSHEPVA